MRNPGYVCRYTGGMSQLWYDNPATYKKKYDKAKAKGLRALGMWTADSAGMDKTKTQPMWDALPDPHKVPAPPSDHSSEPLRTGD